MGGIIAAVVGAIVDVASTVGSAATAVGEAVGIGGAAEAGGAAGAAGAEAGADVGASALAGGLAEGLSAPVAAGATGVETATGLTGGLAATGATAAPVAATAGLTGVGGADILGTGVSTGDVGLATTAGSVGQSLYSMLSTPSVKPVQIPTAALDQLNAEIAANGALSDQARATGQQALSMYNAGQLSPAYAGQYQAIYNQQLTQIKQQLAAQGYTADSTQYESAMGLFNQNMANQYSQMLQAQLTSGLQAANLSDQQIQDYLQEWGIEISGTQAGIQKTQLGTQQQTAAGTALGNLGATLTGANKPTTNITNVLGQPQTTPQTFSLADLQAPSGVLPQAAAGSSGFGTGEGVITP